MENPPKHLILPNHVSASQIQHIKTCLKLENKVEKTYFIKIGPGKYNPIVIKVDKNTENQSEDVNEESTNMTAIEDGAGQETDQNDEQPSTSSDSRRKTPGKTRLQNMILYRDKHVQIELARIGFKVFRKHNVNAIHYQITAKLFDGKTKIRKCNSKPLHLE